ncbi:GNAT family N-acetyltransferase [Nocardioides iriomotensis]|uniref:GNAT family N-acetyltransferase n=2 Tax=Nocardioides iriomotensis TaxID=715784 RepID=A0A4Q5J8X6_9ACTN|nr:GNAT family N-acetyltransferase [Nocardioides iriomotensis]RYU14155.1 GNAT family N-acetyltransferase [Nocardioides iriomotensis]
MTDLLGEMTAWSATSTTVRAEDGSLVEIALADIVSGKPVPPRPSVRLRVSPDRAERLALAGWPAPDSEPLGDWVLRAAGGFSARANSALASGSPGVPFAEAVAAVCAFYDTHGLPAWVQVVVGTDEHRGFEEAGWMHARPGEADSCFQIASTAQVARALRPLVPADAPPAHLAATASDAWLANDSRALRSPGVARAVLEGPADVGFVTVGPTPDDVWAKGRVSAADDWAGFTDVWVDPAQRRRGLALVVVQELVRWAAERGAGTAYLQTRGDNPAALALYDRLGFVTHHEYRYLAP